MIKNEVMTQEEKQLLMADLSARLPYGIKCTTKSLWNGIYTIVGYKDNRFFLDCPIYDEGDDEWMIESIVPYLRPMSSMTEEERKEVNNLIKDNRPIPYGKINNKGMDNLFSSVAVTSSILIDWLNAHHFDYRGLMPMGLAHKALKGMYK
jgi:hypothetical protein